ncbi:hypothetical protein D3C80_985160 [compost metagenome]
MSSLPTGVLGLLYRLLDVGRKQCRQVVDTVERGPNVIVSAWLGIDGQLPGFADEAVGQPFDALEIFVCRSVAIVERGYASDDAQVAAVAIKVLKLLIIASDIFQPRAQEVALEGCPQHFRGVGNIDVAGGRRNA